MYFFIKILWTDVRHEIYIIAWKKQMMVSKNLFITNDWDH